MKTVLEYEVVEQQMMDMGMNSDLIIMLKDPKREKSYRLTVFPDESCRETGKPFELWSPHDHEDDIVYCQWSVIKDMILESIYVKREDIKYLLRDLDEESDIISNVREDSREPHLEAYQSIVDWKVRLMVYGENIEEHVPEQISPMTHKDKDSALLEAISWGKEDGIKVLDGTGVLYHPNLKANV